MVTIMKNVCMYATLLIVGVLLVSFALKTVFWFLAMMFLDPISALGYLALGTIMVIGVFAAIDKIRE